ncbi:hypothetical protein BCV71DRAFT_58037 [Rhizopus microsporus]|uniref:Uncharacterized protein n=1 Tax=Rhizopus microsporus TaxID=58291 RepID=A0A1X0SAW0_RHIZD|nr:hypothetical protein BCV71DRAFT_58037 [Rhizopus microsporus]
MSVRIRHCSTVPLARNSDDQIWKCFEWVTAMLKKNMDYLASCVFVDESVFCINIGAPYECFVNATEELPSCSNWK